MDPTWSATQSVAEKPVESALPSTITLSEIQRDRLTKIAEDNWSKAAGGGGGGKDSGGERRFNPELVEEIYKTELLVKGGRKPVPLQRVMILEVTQYLENYLWPNFDPDAASFEHVISMILIVNEKVKYNCCEVHIQSIKFLFLLILFIIV